MSTSLFSNAYPTTAPTVSQNILAAGNYYLEAISLFMPTITTIAAGPATAGLFVISTSLTNNYAFWNVSCIGTGAASLIVVNAVLSMTPKLVLKRGDGLVFFLVNGGNVSGASFGGNFYGAKLP